jgi:hypothetical protein
LPDDDMATDGAAEAAAAALLDAAAVCCCMLLLAAAAPDGGVQPGRFGWAMLLPVARYGGGDGWSLRLWARMWKRTIRLQAVALAV